MELTKHEVIALEEAIKKAEDLQLRELNDLQLAFAGGGIGDVVVN